MTRGRKPKNPADFGKQFEELKKTIPAKEEHDMFLETTFRQESDREKELEIEELKKYDNQMGKTDLSDFPETKFEKAIKKVSQLGKLPEVSDVTDKNVGMSPLEELQEYVEKCEKYSLENLQELEKKLRDCTTENPTVITYGFTGDKTSLYIEFFDHIKVVADISSVKMFCLESKKPYLATAQKMHEVLKKWSGE